MKQILIVDDDVTVLRRTEELVSSLVEDKGAVEILTASLGVEALGIMSYSRIDLLITDYSMPVLDGLELIAQLHDRLEMRKVLLTFSLPGIRDRMRIAEVGVDEIFLKPVDEFRLKKVLHRCLWTSRTINERGVSNSENSRKNRIRRRTKSENCAYKRITTT
ncbi:MAG: response regulator [Candidatus Manganitrophus sp. SB1]|nr:response regulator [Candidatus Manganitrophus morganii]